MFRITRADHYYDGPLSGTAQMTSGPTVYFKIIPESTGPTLCLDVQERRRKFAPVNPNTSIYADSELKYESLDSEVLTALETADLNSHFLEITTEHWSINLDQNLLWVTRRPQYEVFTDHTEAKSLGTFYAAEFVT